MAETDNQLVRKEFDAIVDTRQIIIPDSIDVVKEKLSGLGSLMTAGDWARAAVVRAWVEPKMGKRSDLGEYSSRLTLRDFANLGIQGLSTRDSVRHYWQAWEKTGLPVPVIGEEVDLPDEPFPEWAKDTMALKWTRDQESFTPEQYIEAARKVMGSIDTDPASNESAQKIVKAKVYYTKETNGLDKPWVGNIFLNPPYSHPEVKQFVDKLLAELKPKQQAILLTNNNTDTEFFHDASHRADVLCFTKGRINFLKPDGSESSPTNGQTFFYFGERKDRFIEQFSKFGILMQAI